MSRLELWNNVLFDTLSVEQEEQIKKKRLRNPAKSIVVDSAPIIRRRRRNAR